MNEIPWQDRFSTAAEMAKADEKPLFLYFWTPD